MKYVWISVALVFAYMAGSANVANEEYQTVLQWSIILILLGLGMGVAGVIGYGVHIRPRLQKINQLTSDLEKERRQLDRDRETFEKSQKERARHIVESGTMLLLELNEEEKKNALGKQLRHVEEILHQEYRKKLEGLQADNHQLRVALRQMEEARKKTYTGAPKLSNNGNRPGFVEGPPLKRHA